MPHYSLKLIQGIKLNIMPSDLELQIAAELFPGKPAGFPFNANEEADFELPEDGGNYGVPDVDESELQEAQNELREETGFGSVIGGCMGTMGLYFQSRCCHQAWIYPVRECGCVDPCQIGCLVSTCPRPSVEPNAHEA